jgi:poly(glycerol-phosphate) alpha-glucosyltransferase
VANDPAALAAALREAMVLDDEARRAMGARGRALVEQKFGWPGVAEQMLAVYQWMLGRGPRPPCVIS